MPIGLSFRILMYTKILKQTFDFAFSFVVGIIVFPIFLLLVGLLMVSNRGNPFFFQLRPGKKGRVFKLVKFKTMNNKKDVLGKLLPDGERLTSIGRFVRSTSLDELPQLINVLKGDMSLVGPRPLLVKYLERYTKEQARRHEVKPGITGWAQVNGRNGITWDRKFELDVFYVNNLSFLLDLKILWITLEKVLKRSGVTADGQATVEEFKGKQIK
ncbi:MAG: undecaprenyl phosphate N,N'-diacetylbacillosamine 1-phosphate transferase [Salibacteraceae bacterium]|jgi:undecaprenyl phosphate N,N'-diacetylbacillosamine 1-phosphate transferase